MKAEDKLIRAIKESWKTYRTISKLSGISMDSFTNLVARRRRMTVDDYFKICDALGIDPRALLEDRDG